MAVTFEYFMHMLQYSYRKMLVSSKLLWPVFIVSCVDHLITFPGIEAKKQLSYALKQMVAIQV